jgi:cephalosporin hydroxylase
MERRPMNNHRFLPLLCAFTIISAGCRSKSAAPVPSSTQAGPMIYELDVSNQTFHDRLLRGFYDGTIGWKWTARQFAVSIDAPPPRDQPLLLILDFTVPSELIDGVGAATLTARVNRQPVGKQRYEKAGRYYLHLNVPVSAVAQTPALVEFELDKAAKDSANGRELGLIVVGVSLVHPETAVVDRQAATERARQGYLQLLKERDLQMPPAKQHELMKLFHELPVWQHMWFHNVSIEKNPLDLWMMQQIIYETQPEFIVETGTWRGGSALYWAHTLNGMGLENSRVFTIDIQDITATAAIHPLWKKYVTFFKGSSTDPAIVSDIASRVKGHKTLVVLDSDHTAKHVLGELHAYSPMVTSGSYLVVEDTHMDGVPTQPDFGPGPLAATLQFLKEGGAKDFEQDLSREALVMTFNPGGWLRRK